MLLRRERRGADVLDMLLALCVLSAVAAVILGVRWLVTRVDALGRVRDYPAISTAVCLVISATCGIPVLRHARFERQLASVASTLANATVTVRCQTLTEAWTEARPEAGYVRYGPGGRPELTAMIAVQTCDDLRAWVGSDRDSPTEGEVIAVHVLTHEAMHMAGHTDEAVAECAAVQRDTRTATLLGATRAQAQALAATYWQTVYERLPDEYRTATCAPGGPLDERLDDPPWSSAVV